MFVTGHRSLLCQRQSWWESASAEGSAHLRHRESCVTTLPRPWHDPLCPRGGIRMQARTKAPETWKRFRRWMQTRILGPLREALPVFAVGILILWSISWSMATIPGENYFAEVASIAQVLVATAGLCFAVGAPFHGTRSLRQSAGTAGRGGGGEDQGARRIVAFRSAGPDPGSGNRSNGQGNCS